MTTTLEVLHRPAPSADYRAPSRYRPAGFLIALLGLTVVAVAFAGNVAAGFRLSGGSEADAMTARETLAWSWGLNTLGFSIVEVAIAVILIGIVYCLWMRVDSVKQALPGLRPPVEPVVETGDVRTPWGTATQRGEAPASLAVDLMAKRLWAPMLVTGAAFVAAGFVVSLVWASKVADGTQQAATAWTQGLQFLGEAVVLAGIGMLLGTILAGLREGGGEVQESLGVTVRTLKMPPTAKLFVVVTALGLMVSAAQFVFHVGAAHVPSSQSFASWLAWLGPTREVGLGLILSGIVLALVAIGDVLAFQFDRVRQIITTGS